MEKRGTGRIGKGQGGLGRGNLSKTILARDIIFASKCTKKELAAGLRPDTLGKLNRSRSQEPLAAAGGYRKKHPIAAVRGALRRRGR